MVSIDTPSTSGFPASLKSPSVDTAVGAGALLQDEVEPFGPDSFPGSRVADLFQPRIHTHAPPSRKDDKVAKYRTSLDVAWAAACGDESCFFFFFFFFKSSIYNAGLARSPRAAHTNTEYSTTTLRSARDVLPKPRDLLLAGKRRPQPTNIPLRRRPFER
jgi:hypothetical protein